HCLWMSSIAGRSHTRGRRRSAQQACLPSHRTLEAKVRRRAQRRGRRIFAEIDRVQTLRDVPNTLGWQHLASDVWSCEFFEPHAMSELSPECAPKRTSAICGFTPWREMKTSRRQSGDCSMAPRCGDGVQPVVAEHMR